jgi:hypothetical protein
MGPPNSVLRDRADRSPWRESWTPHVLGEYMLFWCVDHESRISIPLHPLSFPLCRALWTPATIPTSRPASRAVSFSKKLCNSRSVAAHRRFCGQLIPSGLGAPIAGAPCTPVPAWGPSRTAQTAIEEDCDYSQHLRAMEVGLRPCGRVDWVRRCRCISEAARQ